MSLALVALVPMERAKFGQCDDLPRTCIKARGSSSVQPRLRGQKAVYGRFDITCIVQILHLVHIRGRASSNANETEAASHVLT